jgi:ParB family chromosome partitioning protein
LTTFDVEARQGLFAHCVSLSVNAVHEAWSRRPRAIAHADRLAQTLSLDIAAAGWTPTVDNFLGRVTKARILGAVREAKGEASARQIEHLKKGDMAIQAEQMLVGTGWLPEPLRTPGRAFAQSDMADVTAHDEAPVEGTAAIESKTAIDEDTAQSGADSGSTDDPETFAE